MTEQPPPGSYPPPADAGATLDGGLPKAAYTPWITRVLAWILDYIPVFIINGIGFGALLGTRETLCLSEISEYDLGEVCATGASTLGQVLVTVCGLLALAFYLWNYGYRQGTTGASIGKAIMKFRIVGEATGRPIGFGMSVARQLIYLVANVVCFFPWLVAVLFPLWDPKAQTLVDKLVKTVALPN